MKKISAYSLVCLMLIGCGGGGSTIPATTNSSSTTNSGTSSNAYDAPIIEDTVKQNYLDAINQARSKQQDCGREGIKKPVDPLTWNDALYKAAYEHSEDMAESNTFSHDGSGTNSDWTAQILLLTRGSTFDERIINNGYSNFRTIGENLTVGTNGDLAQKAINAWLKSDEHCKNLMNPAYKEVGMAHVEKAGTKYTHYWSQEFGAKR